MKNLTFLLVAFPFCFAIILNTGNAQTPSNTCIDINYAIPFGTCTGEIATIDIDVEPTSPALSCPTGGPFKSEAWYAFIVPPGPNLNVNVTGTSTYAASDLVIQIISGTCASQTEIACVNNISNWSYQTESVTVPNMAPGTYIIRYINVGGTTGMRVNMCVDAVVGISENENESLFSISPNPFTSETTISFKTEMINADVTLSDVTGKEVNRINFSGKQLVIAKGKMSAGVYLMQITDETKNVVRAKLVVQ